MKPDPDPSGAKRSKGRVGLHFYESWVKFYARAQLKIHCICNFTSQKHSFKPKNKKLNALNFSNRFIPVSDRKISN